MLKTKIINANSGGVLNRDADFGALGEAIINAGVISGLELTGGNVTAGKAFIEVTRTSVTPNESWLVYVENTANIALSTDPSMKIYLQVKQANLNDQSLNTDIDGQNIVEL
ncbi:MAG TPA: hypothetical protein PLQ36_02025, partial [Candidatus Gracilibacteria bacterium]|nr:hypothetical protein [Candidatus Gracilibacteria bacterium]